MFKLSPVEKLAYKERAHHEHPNLLEKLGKILKMPVDTKKMGRNFSCHTKTVCTKTNPFTQKTKKRKKRKRRKKKRKTVKNKDSFLGFF